MSAASEVCAALGVGGDDGPAAVLEPRGGDASFLLGSLLWRALSDPDAAALVVCARDPPARRRAVARRLGHDLATAEAAGRARLLEPFAAGELRPAGEEAAERAIAEAARALAALPGRRRLLLVDDLGELVCAGAPLAAAVRALDRLLALRRLRPGLRLVLGCGFDDRDAERTALANCVAHAARRRYTVAGLATGASAQVTGSVLVERFDSGSLVAGSTLFHYRATDRAVKLFAPGAAGLGR